MREDIIGSPQEEDLKMWRHSELGRCILAGDHETLSKLGITRQQQEVLRELLSEIDGKEGERITI